MSKNHYVNNVVYSLQTVYFSLFEIYDDDIPGHEPVLSQEWDPVSRVVGLSTLAVVPACYTAVTSDR